MHWPAGDPGVSTVNHAVYTEYPDPRRDEWATMILPKLKAMSTRELMEKSGLSERALQMIRAGRRPSSRNRLVLARVVKW